MLLSLPLSLSVFLRLTLAQKSFSFLPQLSPTRADTKLPSLMTP